MSYSIDYSDDGSATAENTASESSRRAPSSRRFAVPSIVKTTAAFALGAVLLFGLEVEAPVAYRPSSLMGTYDARVEQQVKAAELRVQGRYEGWAAQVKANADQNVEQYKAKAQTFIQAYQGGIDRAKLYANAATQLQLQTAGAEIDQTRAEQSGEIGVLSMGRIIGRVMNIVQPGTGDDALDWVKARKEELANELREAAEKGVHVSAEGWDTNLPDPAVLQSQLDSIRPMTVPPLPPLDHDAASAGN